MTAGNKNFLGRLKIFGKMTTTLPRITAIRMTRVIKLTMTTPNMVKPEMQHRRRDSNNILTEYLLFADNVMAEDTMPDHVQLQFPASDDCR